MKLSSDGVFVTRLDECVPTSIWQPHRRLCAIYLPCNLAMPPKIVAKLVGLFRRTPAALPPPPAPAASSNWSLLTVPSSAIESNLAAAASSHLSPASVFAVSLSIRSGKVDAPAPIFDHKHAGEGPKGRKKESAAEKGTGGRFRCGWAQRHTHQEQRARGGPHLDLIYASDSLAQRERPSPIRGADPA